MLVSRSLYIFLLHLLQNGRPLRCQITPEDLQGILHKLVGDVFGVLCIRTSQYYKCSGFLEEPHWAA